MTILSQISDATQALVEKTAPRVVALNAGHRNAASGILWRPGLIVTADEAISDDENVEVMMPDGSTAAAGFAGHDPSTDISSPRPPSRSANWQWRSGEGRRACSPPQALSLNPAGAGAAGPAA